MALAKFEEGINICPSVPQDVQSGAYTTCSYEYDEPFSGRKRVSSSTDECSSSKRLNPTMFSDATLKIEGAIGKHVPTCTKLSITERFNSYVRDLWSSLIDDSALKIGICGLGGLGKTEVAKYIHNHLLEVPSKFDHVFWVDLTPLCSIWNTETMSRGQRVGEIQSRVSKELGVHLSDGDDEAKRAAILMKALAEKKRCAVFLDDVWDYVSPQEVGIPIGVDQCTMVFTTRKLQVCRQFDCQRRIDIECLTLDESYDLYMDVLGGETKLSELGKVVSKSIACECGGFPLAITIMAGNMRGIADVSRIRSMNRHMKKKVDLEMFQKLRVSYDDMKDLTLQHCFLCCPFFIELNYKELMKFIVDEGIIKGKKSLREVLDVGCKMIQVLQDMCFLEIDNDDFVHMNVVIQRMAIHIMEENRQSAMIQRGQPDQSLPSMESWNEDLVRVSLTESNQIESIPSNYSPSCSKLSTLLLSRIWSLRHIGDSFFQGFPGLKILCLSQTSIETLPMSLYSLSNLTALILQSCKSLREIPLVAKLSALEKLDLSYSGVEEVPDDIQMLSKLKHLDLFESKVVRLNRRILANLCYLQLLRLPWSSPVKAEEVTCLRHLESLTCHFTDFVELNKYLVSQETREIPLQLCVQAAGGQNIIYPYHFEYHEQDVYSSINFRDQYELSNVLCLCECDNANGLVDLKNNFQFQHIIVAKCNEARSFCTFSPINSTVKLSSFSATDCDGIEFLFSTSSVAKGMLDKLKNIKLYNLKRFERLFNEGGIPILPPYGSCFSQLTSFFIQDCPAIKQLFPLHLLPNLKNLAEVDVKNCALMEEIFATEGGEQVDCFYLPKLHRFELVGLPQLKSICKVQLICNALMVLNFERCPNLNVDCVQVYRTQQSLEKIPLYESPRGNLL